MMKKPKLSKNPVYDRRRVVYTPSDETRVSDFIFEVNKHLFSEGKSPSRFNPKVVNARNLALDSKVMDHVYAYHGATLTWSNSFWKGRICPTFELVALNDTTPYVEHFIGSIGRPKREYSISRPK